MGEWYKLYSGVYGSIFISYSIGKHEIAVFFTHDIVNTV